MRVRVQHARDEELAQSRVDRLADQLEVLGNGLRLVVGADVRELRAVDPLHH